MKAIDNQPHTASPHAQMATVSVRFKAIGGVDQIDPSSASFPRHTRFGELERYVAEQLHRPISTATPLWVYVGNAYVPDDELPLASVPGAETGELVVSYSVVEAFA